METRKPHTIPWESVEPTTGVNPTGPGSELLGVRVHGLPVVGADGNTYWVESHQWRLLPDGSRENPRYRVVRVVPGTQTTRPFPFDQPGKVSETTDEHKAGWLLSNLVNREASS